MIMKLTLFMCVFLVITTLGNGFSQQRITMKLGNTTIKKALTEFQRQTNKIVIYSDNNFSTSQEIIANFKDVEMELFLAKILEGSGMTYKLMKDYILILPLKESVTDSLNQLKKYTIKGIVKDEGGGLMPGVTVLIKGTQVGVATDIEGKFEIATTNSDKLVLVFSFVGMQTKYVTVGNNTVINVVLEEEINRLDEVVAVGYGTTKAKDMTGAVSRLGKKEIETAPMGASIQSMLQGRAPGVNVMISSASPTSPVSVIIRGSSSLSGDSQPLWVIDGVPEYSAGTSGNISNTLYNLNLTDVETIDILKDASATAIYGSRAANGVVLVTTKRGKKGMKPTLEFSARYGIQTMNANDFGVLNAEEYIALSKASVRASFFTRGSLDYFTRQYIDETKFNAKTNYSQFDLETLTDDLFLEDAYYGADTDWWDLMTHNAATQEYSLGIRGGSKESSYSSSFFYKDQKGIVKGGDSLGI